MNVLGVHLTLMLGRSPVAVPAPPQIVEALEDVEVTHSDRERSGFQLAFVIGRSGPFDLIDFQLVVHPLLQLNTRCVLVAHFNGMPQVISDGIVKNRQVIPGDKPGEGRLILSGQDVGVAMEKVSEPTEHPALNAALIASFLTLKYPELGLSPLVVPPTISKTPNPVESVPVQRETDRAYLVRLAIDHGHTFFIDPGPAPLRNIAYFGPPVIPGVQQKALSVNMGPATNVTEISFSNDAQAARQVITKVLDTLTGQTMPVAGIASTRAPLGALPDYVLHAADTEREDLNTSGMSFVEALGRAQGMFDTSVDDAVTATGTLDTLRYNGILRARSRVDLRGAGYSFDGTYRVRRVHHRIREGRYTQSFTISRHDIGALAPVVRVA